MRALSDVPRRFHSAPTDLDDFSSFGGPHGAVGRKPLGRRNPPGYLAMPTRHSEAGHATVRRTTSPECLLLAIIIVLLPLEEHIPTVAGVSLPWIIFGMTA